MWRIGCGTCIALLENGRMKSHLVAVRMCFPDIIDKSRFMHVACSCFIQGYMFGFKLVYPNGNTALA
jgi:hypothetical protein